VKPTLFLRIASVLTFVHCVLHTVGGVFGKPRNGLEEIAVQETMKGHVFNVMGSMRSYWDFFFGYGLGVTITLLIQSLLFWQLATMCKTSAAWTRPIVVLFFFNFVAMSVVVWRYFFIAPAVTELLIAACLAAAYFTAAAPA
jgi:phosphoglycerol transferase MdoB-like AlkP superfamily enzyme